MYKNKSRKRKIPQDTKFWHYASNLKKAGHKTIVHALAWEFPSTYEYLINLLQQDTPLERITILLWRDYSNQMKTFEKKGYGTFSPTALRRFKEKYFSTGKLPNPRHRLKTKLSEAQSLIIQANQSYALAKKVYEIDKRVWPTKLGQKLRQESFDATMKVAKLQSQLS